MHGGRPSSRPAAVVGATLLLLFLAVSTPHPNQTDTKWLVKLFTEPVVDTLPPPPPPPPQLFSLSDIHGDYLRFGEALRVAALTDANGVWQAPIGSSLVHTGDLIDRGGATLDVVQYMQAIEANASSAGSNVHLLLGNHEVMNLLGDLRYVLDEDISAFGGHAARARAFASDGLVGSWLLRRFRVCHIERATVFVHAGAHPKWAALGCDGMNARASAELSRLVPTIFDLDVAAGKPHDDAALTRGSVEARRRAGAEAAAAAAAGGKGDPTMMEAADGPVWYRGYALEPEEKACPLLDIALGQLGVRRMVVGHTVQDSPIGQMRLRCGGRLVLADTGFSRALDRWLGEGDRAAVLRVGLDGEVDAMYVTPTAAGEPPEQ